MANRGAPTDYDEWDARGAAGWKWNEVLPFSGRSSGLDFDGPYTARMGSIPVRRIPRAALDAAFGGVRRSISAAGHQFVADQNGEFVDGYFQ